LALSSCVVSFAYSKWNAEISDDSKIIVLEQVHMYNKEPNPVKTFNIYDIYSIIIFNNNQIKRIFLNVWYFQKI